MSDQTEIDGVSRAKTTVRSSLKIPDFVPDDPELWISQLEIQFEAAEISSQRDKFVHLASNLPPTLALEVRDILIHPPQDRPYDILRAAILQ